MPFHKIMCPLFHSYNCTAVVSLCYTTIKYFEALDMNVSNVCRNGQIAAQAYLRPMSAMRYKGVEGLQYVVGSLPSIQFAVRRVLERSYFP